MSLDITKLPPSILNYIPAGKPPPGTWSNFADPESRGPLSLVSIYVMLPLMAWFLLLRVYVRMSVQRCWGVDDYLAVLSALCTGGYCGILIYLVDGPGGEHAWDVPISKVTAGIMKANLASQCVYGLASIMTKIALLVLYLRIFKPALRAVNEIWVGIGFVLVSHVAITIAAIAIQVPKRGESWLVSGLKSGAGGDYVQKQATAVVAAQGVISSVTDFLVLCIPIRLVVGLHLPTGKKVGVYVIFMSGLIACICSLVGTVLRFKLRSTKDMFWDSIPVYILTVVEINVGIICSCMPILPLVFKHIGKSEQYRKSFSLVRYFRPGTKTSNPSEEKAAGLAERGDISHKVRVAIPRPTMTGLGTFIRGGGPSHLGTSDGDEAFEQLESIDDEYHTQLKAVKR